MNGQIDLYTALKRMHELTEAGAPFSFEYYKLNGELRVVNNAVLRSGYSKDFSERGVYLIAYTDMQSGKHRQFHRSLLMKLNNTNIKR